MFGPEVEVSLFDVFAAHVSCPACGDPGARSFLWVVKCRNMACRHFDPESMQQAHLQPPGMPAPGPAGAFGSPRPPRPKAHFGASALKGNVTIHYRNFRGEEKRFRCDAATARRRRNHLSVRVEPTGRRIALNRDRITNLKEVERLIPSPTERQILSYHRSHRTSSPRYEETLRKYPHLA